MSLSVVDLSATDRALLQKMILLLEAALRHSSQTLKFSEVDAKVVTGT